MIKAEKISLILCGGIYFAIGLFGYLLFEDSIMADILVNFDQNSGSIVDSPLNGIVRLSYVFHLILVFPLLNFSLKANHDEFLFPKKLPLAKDTKRFIPLTLILLVVAYLAAIAIPNIWYFFQFLGFTFVVFLAFIFPGAIALSTSKSTGMKGATKAMTSMNKWKKKKMRRLKRKRRKMIQRSK